ncbi:hypothetical protein TELCIR_20834 [Teladorsagia circumcincta]|uniref:Integrase catalytic domain-containing protein n=1 Tax=Teladorsagia circumcincta TaxID=45464 RepID=A0A2G9TIF2_TELCI|nr:hypothetical protein TELCIR_20834 [Teladorsagia circumcincta]
MSTLVSDNASYLKGELLSELGRLLQIGRYFTTPYHHEGNGACERMFATFQEMLRTYISSTQMDWDEFLPACTLAYNTSVHSSTNEFPFSSCSGVTPSLTSIFSLSTRWKATYRPMRTAAFIRSLSYEHFTLAGPLPPSSTISVVKR